MPDLCFNFLPPELPELLTWPINRFNADICTWLHRWSLGMDTWFHPPLYKAYNHLSMLRLKVNPVNKGVTGTQALTYGDLIPSPFWFFTYIFFVCAAGYIYIYIFHILCIYFYRRSEIWAHWVKIWPYHKRLNMTKFRHGDKTSSCKETQFRQGAFISSPAECEVNHIISYEYGHLLSYELHMNFMRNYLIIRVNFLRNSYEVRMKFLWSSYE